MIKELVNKLKLDLYAPISLEHGFVVKQNVDSMPQTHREWDTLASEIPDLIATFNLENKFAQLPLLHADADTLSHEYLLRASILVSGFAHAFYYPDGYSDKKPLPDSILIPMEEIAKRINKKISQPNCIERDQLYVGRTYLEDFIGNWEFDDSLQNNSYTLSDIQINKLRLLMPYFRNQEEYISSVITGPLMQARFAPVVKILVDIEAELSQDTPNNTNIIEHLDKITFLLKNVKDSFMLMTPKLSSPYYVDQVIWPQTSPTIGKKAHQNEAPNTGADSPIFHVIDKLLNRIEYTSKMGQNIVDRFKSVPENYQQFIIETEQVGVKLFKYINSKNDENLNDAFRNLALTYAGPNGLLDAHRKKAYGFLKMSFLGGRLLTNGKEQGSANTNTNVITGLTPWGRLNGFFLNGMKERLNVLERLNIPYNNAPLLINSEVSFSSSSTLYTRYQIAKANTDENMLAIYQNQVFDLSQIIKTHPGGHRIISSLLGSDMTIELEQAHHFNLAKIVSLLGKHYRGDIYDMDNFPIRKNVIINWSKTLFLIAEIQNNIKNIWFFDADTVGDRKRYVPYQFVMKTLSTIFGTDGYFESLLGTIDSNLLNNYRELQLKNIDGLFPVKFINIGKLAIKLGLDEIKTKKITKISDTEINKLHVYQLYNQLVIKSIECLELIKNDISTNLDKLKELDDATLDTLSIDHFNANLKANTFSIISDFIMEIDTSKILISPPLREMPLNISLFFDVSKQINVSAFYGALALMALATSMTTESTELRLASGVVLLTSLIGLSRKNIGFFSNKAESPEPSTSDEKLTILHH